MPGAPPPGTVHPPLPPRAEILARLDPDLIHPARLAGPHAWHPWGLTTGPPDDRHIHLSLPMRPDNQGQAEHVLAGIADQLRRPAWPPRTPLAVDLAGATLTIESDGELYAEMHCTNAPCSENGDARAGPDVVTRAGWPILNELDALHDRITAIDPLEPTVGDLNDLAHWTTSQANRGPTRPSTAASLRQLMQRLPLHDSGTHQRLQRILTTGGSRPDIAPEANQALTYLHAELTASPSLRSAPVLASQACLHR